MVCNFLHAKSKKKSHRMRGKNEQDIRILGCENIQPQKGKDLLSQEQAKPEE